MQPAAASRAQPYLIAEVLASNIGGAATLIGDPPNIIIGSRAGLTFNDFLVHMAPIVVVVFVVFVLLTRVLFRKSFQYNPEQRRRGDGAARSGAPSPTRSCCVRCLVVLAWSIAGFGLHAVLHLEPSIVALVGAGRDAAGHPCRRRRRRCARSSGPRWCSSWACS